MRILYVVSRPLEINTSASIRNKATIEGLLELGHSVELITTEPDMRHSNHDNSLKNQKLKTTYIKLKGIQNIARIGRKYDFLRPLKRMVYKLFTKIEIYDNLKNIVNYADKMNITQNNYDLIISSSDPKSSHLFVKKLYEKKNISNIPWIQIWGDPFLSDITRTNKMFNKKIKSEENKLLKHASKVVYVSQLTLLEQKKIFPQHAGKMQANPIPYLKEKIYPSTDLSKDSLTFLYTGDYSSNVRNIMPLYEAIKHSNHKLIICGNTDLKIVGNDRIQIFPRVSYEKVKELELECDVLVHLSNLSGTQIPGKIYQYSGTNKHILFILDGEREVLKKVFEGYHRYIFTDNSKASILETIESVKTGLYDKHNYIVDEFKASSVAKKILEI